MISDELRARFKANVLDWNTVHRDHLKRIFQFGSMVVATNGQVIVAAPGEGGDELPDGMAEGTKDYLAPPSVSVEVNRAELAAWCGAPDHECGCGPSGRCDCETCSDGGEETPCGVCDGLKRWTKKRAGLLFGRVFDRELLARTIAALEPSPTLRIGIEGTPEGWWVKLAAADTIGVVMGLKDAPEGEPFGRAEDLGGAQ